MSKSSPFKIKDTEKLFEVLVQSCKIKSIVSPKTEMKKEKLELTKIKEDERQKWVKESQKSNLTEYEKEKLELEFNLQNKIIDRKIHKLETDMDLEQTIKKEKEFDGKKQKDKEIVTSLTRLFFQLYERNEELPKNVTQENLLLVFKRMPSLLSEWSINPKILKKVMNEDTKKWDEFYYSEEMRKEGNIETLTNLNINIDEFKNNSEFPAKIRSVQSELNKIYSNSGIKISTLDNIRKQLRETSELPSIKETFETKITEIKKLQQDKINLEEQLKHAKAKEDKAEVKTITDNLENISPALHKKKKELAKFLSAWEIKLLDLIITSKGEENELFQSLKNSLTKTILEINKTRMPRLMPQRFLSRQKSSSFDSSELYAPKKSSESTSKTYTPPRSRKKNK